MAINKNDFFVFMGIIGSLLIAQSVYEESEELAVKKLPGTPEQNICKLTDEYKKLTSQKQHQAKLRYYSELAKVYGNKKQIDGSRLSLEWLNDGLEKIHPGLAISNRTYYTKLGPITHHYSNDFELAADIAQQQNPLFEITVPMRRHSSSINLYHIIAAEALNKVESINDIQKELASLSTPRTITHNSGYTEKYPTYVNERR